MSTHCELFENPDAIRWLNITNGSFEPQVSSKLWTEGCTKLCCAGKGTKCDDKQYDEVLDCTKMWRGMVRLDG